MEENVLKLMTFNLRVDTPVDGLNRFRRRKPELTDYLERQAADVYGFQEVLPGMNNYLSSRMSDYQWIGLPRSDNEEACPIYYRKDRIVPIDSGTFWLSPTFDKKSVISGSHFIRIATYLVFSGLGTGKFAYFNTHLDYASDQVSRTQLLLLLEQAKLIAKKQRAALIIGGDFNQRPGSSTLEVLTKARLVSVYKEAIKPSVTYHGFGKINTDAPIDHLFFHQKIVLGDCQIDTQCYNGMWLSDHFPVIATFK